MSDDDELFGLKSSRTGEYLHSESADEMFKKLGYKKIYGEYIECGYIGGNHNRIMFTNRKTINGKLCEDLTMQELQAINEKVKELGWNE